MPKPSRKLLLTLDGFATLFHPRLPIPVQYIQTAHELNELTGITQESGLQAAMKDALKAESRARPNYGRREPGFGGPREWWANVIRSTFQTVTGGDRKLEVPDAVVSRLLERFSTKEGYALYDDVHPLLQQLRAWKRRESGDTGATHAFDQIVVGVVSNSDDRVPSIMKSLGISVGDIRATNAENLPAPGFEDRSNVRGVARSESISAETVHDIDFVITSYEAGEEKPHPLIFQSAREQGLLCLRLRGDEYSGSSNDLVCVHVGDDYGKDYKGAADAGWESLLLKRTGGDHAPFNKTVQDGQEGEVNHISTLAELPFRLEEIGTRNR